jgi:antitoxin component YwqK of YwqJK toxin-antitoxin module
MPEKLRCVFLMMIIAASACTHREVEQKFPDGSPKVEKYYANRNGHRELIREVQYYENHQRKMEGAYLDNKRTGKWTAWFKNGKIWSEGVFKDGLSEGLRTVYYENGRKHIVGNYKQDQKTGKWQFYSVDGKLLKEIDFDKK